MMPVMSKPAPSHPPHWPADAVEMWPIDRPRPYAKNSRQHSPEQIDQIVASIREWGWTMPLLADERDTLIAGHARLEAAKLIGLAQVPVMIARGWSQTEIRAYVIADNKLALNSDWSQELLIKEVSALAMTDFDVNLLGFSEAELLNFTMPDRPFDASAETKPRQPNPVDHPDCYRAIIVHLRHVKDLHDFERRMEQEAEGKFMWHPPRAD
jgi:hypothetical protein